MNILQVTNKVPYPTKDGGAIACMNLTKGFSQLGHNVTVLAMNTHKHHVDLDDIPSSVKSVARFHFIDVPAKICWFAAFFNLIFSNKPYNAVRFVNRKFTKKIVDILKNGDFDVVQLEGLYLCPYIPVIRKYSDAVIAYRAHNVEHEIWERTVKISGGLKKMYLSNLAKRIKRFEIKWLNSYDVLVPITERDGKILDNLGNVKAKFVSQTGIDTSLMLPCVKNFEYPSLFHIGSLEWSPNQEGILWFLDECWPSIYKKYPDLRFYVAGRRAPQWFVTKLNVPGVVYKGEVDDASDFMNSKAIMVVPLFSGSGMRVKIVEGMALGKTIVTTPIGAEGINVTDGENILIAETVENFIEKVCAMVEDRSAFDEIGKNAINFIQENFDNLVASSELIDFYKLKVK